MAMRNERFADLEAVRAERLRLAAMRDGHADRIQSQLALLGQKDFRRAMLRTVTANTISGMFPDGILGAVVGKGGFSRGLELAMGTRGGWAKRIGLFALGAAAPSLLERVRQLPLADIGREISVSLDRLKQYLDGKRSSRREGGA